MIWGSWVKFEAFICTSQIIIMIAGAGRLGNFTGKFCTDGGKITDR